MTIADRLNSRGREHIRRVGQEGPSLRRSIPGREHRIAMYDAQAWSENKRAQREFLFNETRRLFSGTRNRLKVLSLPGESWEFERSLCQAYDDVELIGVECDRRSFESGLLRLPDGRMLRDTFNVSGREVESARVKRCAFINAYLDQVMFGRATGPLKNRWNGWFAGFDLIWLDLNSPLGTDRTLSYIRQSIQRFRSDGNVLLAVSFVVGRDDATLSRLIRECPGHSAIERRVAFLRFLLGKEPDSRVMSAQYHQYRSAKATSTLTIGTACLFIKRSKKRKRKEPSAEVVVGDTRSVPTQSMCDYVRTRRKGLA